MGLRGWLCGIANWMLARKHAVRPNKAYVILSEVKDLPDWIRFFGFGKQASE